MIARVICFALALAPASLYAQKSQAWLHAIDYRHRVLYVTGIQDVDLPTAASATNYLNRFVTSMKWSGRQGQDHLSTYVFANRDHFANFVIVSGDAGTASADRARRDWLIAKYRDIGYRIEDIRMPAPLALQPRTQNDSQAN